MNLEYYKAFLWPPEEFLHKIEFSDTDSYWGIDIIPYTELSYASFVYTRAQVTKLRSLWFDNYKNKNRLTSTEIQKLQEKGLVNEFSHSFLFTVSELIKNTFEHGNNKKTDSVAHVGYWFNEKGIILGIKDEGNFYSKIETAEKFQRKEIFTSTKEIPSGLGLQQIYYEADFLEVVTEKNSLFTGFIFIPPTE